jgi:threonine aldolase
VPVPGDVAHPPLDAWRALAAAPTDELKPRTSTLVLENTHNRAGGTPLDAAYVEAVLAIARSAGLRTHLDGSRVFNAAVALGVEPSRLCRGFDTVAISLNKGLGAPIGGMLAGTTETIARALVVRQRLGGGVRPTGILAAAALEAMRDWSHLAADHARARMLAAALATLPGASVQEPATYIVLVVVHERGPDAAAVCRQLDVAGVKALPFGTHRIRLVTYRDVSDADVARVVDAFRGVLSVDPAAGVAQ